MNDFRESLFTLARLGRCGKYVDAGGVKTYYEVHGDGEPLLMLHGGMSTLDTFRFQIPFLARYYRVILPERRGHGHTADVPGAYSYEQMASDTATFLKVLGLKKVRAIGYSDGANLLIPLTLKEPDLIERFISIGGNFHSDGTMPGLEEELNQVEEGNTGECEDRNYRKYSPDGPEHYAEVFRKVKKLWLEEPKYTASDIMKITVPGLILAGDRDVIRLEHTAQFYESLRAAELCIVPGTTHGLIKEKPNLVNSILLDFLSKPLEDLYLPEA